MGALPNWFKTASWSLLRSASFGPPAFWRSRLWHTSGHLSAAAFVALWPTMSNKYVVGTILFVQISFWSKQHPEKGIPDCTCLSSWVIGKSRMCISWEMFTCCKIPETKWIPSMCRLSPTPRLLKKPWLWDPYQWELSIFSLLLANAPGISLNILEIGVMLVSPNPCRHMAIKIFKQKL